MSSSGGVITTVAINLLSPSSRSGQGTVVEAADSGGSCPQGPTCTKRSGIGRVIVRRIVSLGVELINERDIVVSQAETGFSVTYRKDGEAPMLYAITGIDRSDDPSKVKFWAQA